MVKAEIIRRPRARKAELRAELERIVCERVDEILAHRDGELFEGEFLSSRALSDEMIRRTNLFDRRKWALYFARWGCRDCKKKRLAHKSLGYCGPCYIRIRQRLAALKQDWDAEHPAHPPELDAIDEKIRTAKRVFEQT